MKKLISVLVCFALVFSFMPLTAGAADEGTLSFDPETVTPTGAEIYINGALVEKNPAPCDLTLPAGDNYTVELKIPGYETYKNEDVDIVSGAITTLSDIKLLPELVDTEPGNVIIVNTSADTEEDGDITIGELGATISFRQAVTAVMNSDPGPHYRIEFSVADINLERQLDINKRGSFTINGDTNRDGEADVNIIGPQGIDIKLLESNVRMIGLKFSGYGGSAEDSTLSVRPNDTGGGTNMQNDYILNCVFSNSFEVGLAPCGAYGYAGKSNGEDTFNVKDIYFCGNSFDNTLLFSFAGAGDEDYNHVDGYYVYANIFKNCGIGLLAGDAHTWYVFGKDTQNGGMNGQIGYCENNIFENIIISGNICILDEHATRQYISPIMVSVANMGNSGNITRKVTIKNNLVMVDKPENANLFSTISIGNTTVGDDGAGKYTAPPAGMEQGDNNLLQDVSVVYNDLQTGDGSAVEINNIDVCEGYQNGANNIAEDINIAFNKIQSARGLAVSNYSGNCELGSGQGNIMRRVTVAQNRISTQHHTNNPLDFDDTGISILGAALADDHTYRGDDFMVKPGGMLTDVCVKDNTLLGFSCGISVAGGKGWNIDGAKVDGVELGNNTLTCKASARYGIEVYGAGYGNYMDTDHDPDYLNKRTNGNTNCTVQNLTVSGNNVNARGGLSIFGAYYDGYAAGKISGNGVKTAAMENNTFTKMGNTEEEMQYKLLPVVAAGLAENWDRLRKFSPNILNNYVSELTQKDNNYTGFDYGVLDFSMKKLPKGLLNAKETYKGMVQATNDAAGEDSYRWDFFSRPATNGSEDSYLFAGYGQVGEYPNLLYPGVIYTEVKGELWDYNITYNVNGGTLPAGARLRYMHEDSFDLPIPTRTGYSFAGWYDNSTLTGTPVARIIASDRDDKAFWAKWTQDFYTVKFNANGGTGTMSAQSIPCAESKMLSANTFTYPGYVFGGWARTAAGAAAYADKAAVKDLAGKGATITLYAVWKPGTYRVQFNANGGTGSMSPLMMTYGVSRALTANAFTRFGYVFGGWAKTAAGGAAYADKAVVKDLDSKGGTVTLYAVWKPACALTLANASGKSLKISWAKVSKADGYELYRSEKAASGYKLVKDTAALSYTDTKLTPGKTYYYMLRAYDKAGTKKVYTVYGAVKSIKVIPLAPAGLKLAKASATSINISYSKAKDVSGYEIQFAASATGAFIKAGTTSGTLYTHKKLTKGKIYYYRVRSYVKSGGKTVYSGWTAVKALTLK